MKINFLSLFKLIFSSGRWLKVTPRSLLSRERRTDIQKLIASLSSIKITEKQSCLHKNGHFKGRKSLSSNNRDTYVLYFSFWMCSAKKRNFSSVFIPHEQDINWQYVETLTVRKKIIRASKLIRNLRWLPRQSAIWSLVLISGEKIYTNVPCWVPPIPLLIYFIYLFFFIEIYSYTNIILMLYKFQVTT